VLHVRTRSHRPCRSRGLRQPDPLIREHLPEIPQQPGFRGVYLLRDPDSDKLTTISLWETKEHLQASVARAAGQAAPAAALTEVRNDTYEVTMSA